MLALFFEGKEKPKCNALFLMWDRVEKQKNERRGCSRNWSGVSYDWISIPP